MADEVARLAGMVSSLRKAGRLDEARAVGRRERGRHPDDARLARSLAWVLCDLVRRDGMRPELLEAHLGELAELLRGEKDGELLCRSLLRRLTDAAWELRRAHDDRGLRALLDVLRQSVHIVPDAEWLATGRARSDGARIEVPTSEAEPLLRPFFSALGTSPQDLDALVSWCGPEPFVLTEDLRRGSWDAPGEKGDAPADVLSGLPRTSFYVEWASPRHGSVGITAYRRSAVREYGAPELSIERSVVRDARLAHELRPHEVYDAVLSPDGRAILGEPALCTDPAVRATFVRRFEGRFERVGSYGFVRLPGGTAAGNDILVPERLVRGHAIGDLSVVAGVAAASFREGEGGDEGSWGFVADAVERVEPPRREDVERPVTGELRVSSGGAAFVGECLVPARMVADHGLRAGDRIDAKTRLRWDRRRRSWGWIAVSVETRD